VRDVKRMERGRDAQAIPQMVEDHLRQREDDLRAGMDALREEVQRAVERIEASQEALLAELRTLRQVLADAGHWASPSDNG
jgi:hypothetical protein